MQGLPKGALQRRRIDPVSDQKSSLKPPSRPPRGIRVQHPNSGQENQSARPLFGFSGPPREFYFSLNTPYSGGYQISLLNLKNGPEAQPYRAQRQFRRGLALGFADQKCRRRAACSAGPLSRIDAVVNRWLRLARPATRSTLRGRGLAQSAPLAEAATERWLGAPAVSRVRPRRRGQGGNRRRGWSG
jgi:hypothetical protein